MPVINSKLLNVLLDIQGTGTFVSIFENSFVFPGLTIEGVGEIGFPISPQQIKDILTVANRASFGKGSDTVYDPNVRSTWEIEAEKTVFKNDDWDSFIENNLKRIKVDFGIENQSISANLNKLLIYQEGDFFKMHKDTEKEKGMFGTMIVCLPSAHTGGDLIVEFENKTNRFSFAESIAKYKIPVVSFYADCNHEVTPVTSGYRVCLIYNLVQQLPEKKIELQYLGKYVEKLAEILKKDVESKSDYKIILLDHQYTPSNFSEKALKHNDGSKAEALLQAAEKAGYYAKLGLVTSYQNGELISDYDYYDRSRYYDDDDDDEAVDGEMGEIFDEHIAIEHWATDKLPTLGVIDVEESDLISSVKINEGEPLEKEATGYTGNAGMEMEYWYHYGAVVLWKKSKHEQILMSLGIKEKLNWLDYYVENWDRIEEQEKNIAKTLVITSHANTNSPIDYKPVFKFLMVYNDTNFIQNEAADILKENFTKISTEDFITLIDKYSSRVLQQLFFSVSNTGNAKDVSHLLNILYQLIVLDRNNDTFVISNLETAFKRLLDLPLSTLKEKNKAISILKSILNLSSIIEFNQKHAELAVSCFMHNVNRDYVNEVLIATILEVNIASNFSSLLTAECKENLANRIANKPTPPADWKREVPVAASRFKREWAILKAFLESPTEQIFDYKNLQAERVAMETAIRDAKIDLEFETIRIGSPHTLRIKKNQAAYLKELKKWEVDVELFKAICR